MAAFDQALVLWRGEPLADAGGAAYAVGVRAGWESIRIRAEEDRLTGLLGAARFSDAVTDATSLLAERPLDERIWATLLRGLAGEGRTSEALAAYEDGPGAAARRPGHRSRSGAAGAASEPAPRSAAQPGRPGRRRHRTSSGPRPADDAAPPGGATCGPR